MRSANCSLRSFNSSSDNSAADFVRNSLASIYRTCRFTNVVDTDSLEPARRNASRAVVSSTPSISNNTFPGRTRAIQYSTLPLPAPIRTSRGLLLIGTSGNTRIQICPPRFTYRAIARRAASISRAVMRARLVAFRPNSPNDTELPRNARPALRPLNILRYLVRFGCIMGAYSQSGLRRDFRRGLWGLRGSARRRGLAFDLRLLDLCLVEHFALEDPNLHADHPVGGTRFGQAVVNVSAEGVQRNAAFAIPLGA